MGGYWFRSHQLRSQKETEEEKRKKGLLRIMQRPMTWGASEEGQGISGGNEHEGVTRLSGSYHQGQRGGGA